MIKKRKQKCILCGSKKKELLYKEKRFPNNVLVAEEVICTGELSSRGKYANIWKCMECGLIFQEPSFSKEELVNAYSGGKDDQYFEQFKQRKRLFQGQLKRIHKYIKPSGKLLDIGAGPGIFVHVAKEANWEAEGLEPSNWGVKEANKRFGVKMRKGVFEKSNYQVRSFDIVTMWDVLEHYTNPIGALKHARKILKNDGVLALTTVNINSWFSKLLGHRWTWLIRVHLWYFTSKTLTKMLEKAGFETLWMGRQIRWFYLPYLAGRFTGMNFSWLPKLSLPAPTGDIIFVIARKIK